ncbi:unnamed protein product, partial [Mesorhabditis belari]|uniref:Spherulation-specific family 4 n=1 Tax=Mesorhabditis belari TaxID=2138241 RepID=A0AAF3ELI2_9BILA
MVFLLAVLGSVKAVGVVVPAYFYPSGTGLSNWNTLAANANKIELTAILNPNSGPGTSADPIYKTAIAKVRAAGGKVIGYVPTGYGKNAIAAVKAQVNKYFSFYTLDGIFFDEMANGNSAAHVNYYKTLHQFVKAKSAKYEVINNPGLNLPEIYVSTPVADRFAVYENPQANYPAYRVTAWMGKYSTNRFIHIVYNATAAQLNHDVNVAIAKHAGSVYITNLKTPNPYAQLPSYWASEVTAVAAKGK